MASAQKAMHLHQLCGELVVGFYSLHNLLSFVGKLQPVYKLRMTVHNMPCARQSISGCGHCCSSTLTAAQHMMQSGVRETGSAV